MGSYSQWEQTQESRVVKRAPEAGSDKPRLSLLGKCPEEVVIDRWNCR